ncbi:MAG: hypothetical protein CMG80_05620 [Marinobacter sp.]|nr:hypothetical protein [Marinobacter sp.]
MELKKLNYLLFVLNYLYICTIKTIINLTKTKMNQLNFNTIYRRLHEAKIMCYDCSHLNQLGDLIQYNIGIIEDWDDFLKVEKEQINNFSKYAYKTAKAYNEALKYSLV